MSPGKPMITIDGEWLLAKIELIEYTLDEIRAVCTGGAFVVPSKPRERGQAPRTRDGTLITGTPQAGVVDISNIEWFLKDFKPAGFKDPWAWAFAYHQDGEVRDEAQAIVVALIHEAKVTVGQYEISWGGREGNLLSRTIPKAKGRRGR